MRLAPLTPVENTLLRKLAPSGAHDSEATHLTPLTNLPARKELAVYSAKQWKGAFGRLMSGERTSLDEDEQKINYDDPDGSFIAWHA